MFAKQRQKNMFKNIQTKKFEHPYVETQKQQKQNKKRGG